MKDVALQNLVSEKFRHGKALQEMFNETKRNSWVENNKEMVPDLTTQWWTAIWRDHQAGPDRHAPKLPYSVWRKLEKKVFYGMTQSSLSLVGLTRQCHPSHTLEISTLVHEEDAKFLYFTNMATQFP